MDLQAYLNRVMRPLWSRIAGVVLRGIVLQVVDQTNRLQLLTIQTGAAGEELTNVERVQNFGFTSNPPQGGQVAVICRGGQIGSPLAIAVDHAASRPVCPPGASAMYNANGATIRINPNGSITITPASGQKVLIDSDVDVNGTLKAATDVQAGLSNISLLTHVHSGGTISGLTGTPQ